MSLSRLVFRAACGIRLYPFLIIVCLFTLYVGRSMVGQWHAVLILGAVVLCSSTKLLSFPIWLSLSLSFSLSLFLSLSGGTARHETKISGRPQMDQIRNEKSSRGDQTRDELRYKNRACKILATIYWAGARNMGHVHPKKNQISLGFCGPICYQSSLST